MERGINGTASDRTLSVFGVEGGVTPTSNRKQIQDIGAEVARNGKVKKSEFYPQKIFGWG